MNFLEERIMKDGVIKPGNVLKGDSFLNHQMDVRLLDEIGKELRRRFGDKKITKVLTIEASGIAIAYPVAREFDVPLVFAKKSKSSNVDADVFSAEVASFTHHNVNQVIVSKKYLSPEDNVLIVDDFLANGNAAGGIMYLIEQAGAELVGMGFIIEKAFQSGGDYLRGKGIRVESLAKIDSLDEYETKPI